MKFNYSNGRIVEYYNLPRILNKAALLMTINGKIYCKRGYSPSEFTMNEERIHQAQQSKLGWYKFLALYIGYWLWNIVTFNWNCYYNIPFEREAKINYKNEDYPDKVTKDSWKKYRGRKAFSTYRNK